MRLLAERVGTKGSAIGIDADPQAVSMANQEIEGFVQAEVRVGSAMDIGIDPHSCDVVMCRHVLAHNGGREAQIVAHLASLVAPGGCVYLADVDATCLQMTPRIQTSRISWTGITTFSVRGATTFPWACVWEIC